MIEAEAAKAPRRRRVRETLPDTPDPVEIAMTTLSRSKDDGPARRLLDTHERLARNELARGRIRAARDICLSLMAVGFVALVVSWVGRAASSQAIVVQSFSVPPALAQRGLTGDVVAQRFLDQLLYIQNNADSIRARKSFANAWSGDLKVQIPSTGVSLDEADALLRRWLGDETTITGEVIAEGDKLEVSVRAGGTTPSRSTVAAGGLDTALRSTAEDVFARQQPYLYAIYLQDRVGGAIKADAVLRQLTRAGSREDRAWAYNGLANAAARRGRLDISDQLYRQALQWNPDLPAAHFNLAANALTRGQDRGLGGVELARRLYAEGADSGLYKKDAVNAFLAAAGSLSALWRADYAQAEIYARQSAVLANYSGSRASAGPRLAAAMAGLHRPGDARATLAASFIDKDERALTAYPVSVGDVEGQALIMIAKAEGDWRGVYSAARTLAEWQTKLGGIDAVRVEAFAKPWMARALAEQGKVVEAQSLIAATPLDCTFCLIVRGRIAAIARQHAVSDRWYRAAIANAPEMPHAHVEWGATLLERGRLSDAAAQARQAHDKAPYWADPLKLWGDALASQSKEALAASKYEAALKLAPQWIELQKAYRRVERE